ncbi:hypothetical protein [uncultured Alistipes sp.]|uniref:hypothetical protein n=1 Tax=uncultured Alistipes sp. TaxID=538949 RepID=UPI00262B206E|nr:hypothetical protein [uncultured Alistipes sp.]
MMRTDERLLAAVEKRYGGPGRMDGLRRLMEAGLLDRRACMKLAVHDRMEELGRQGAGRCEAMVWIADEFCCSYELVRKIVYEKGGR